MWRLIVVTFGTLALAFYELSGGADYAPVENSVQRQGIGPHLPRETPNVTTLASATQGSNPALDTDQSERIQATLASLPVARGTDEIPSPESEAEKIDTLTAQTEVASLPEDADDAAVIAALQDAGAEMRSASTGAIALFARAQREADTQRILRAEAEDTTTAAPRDIRVVQGDLVNMRGGPGTEYEKIAALVGGTEVAVLQSPGDGWIELEVVETGLVGWMADWLVSTAFEATEFVREGANSANAD